MILSRGKTAILFALIYIPFNKYVIGSADRGLHLLSYKIEFYGNIDHLITFADNFSLRHLVGLKACGADRCIGTDQGSLMGSR